MDDSTKRFKNRVKNALLDIWEILIEMVKFIFTFIFTCITSYAGIVIETLISLFVWSLLYRPEWYR